jgi:hypothetical protein
MNKLSQDMDYQETVRAAALAFLERHEGEHLGDFGQLLMRTTNHLVDSINVEKSMAMRLVTQAYSELAAIHARQRIVLRECKEHTLIVTDPVRGCTWSIPVHLVYEHLIAAGYGTRLTPAT